MREKTFREKLRKVWTSFRWVALRPLQKLLTGYSYDMAWEASSAMAEKCYPIFKAFAALPPQGAPTHKILINNKILYTKRFGKKRVDTYLKRPDLEDEELTKALFEHWTDIIQKVLFSLEHVGHNKEEFPDHVYDPNPLYNPNQKEAFYSKPVEGNSELHQLIFNEDYGETKLNSEKLRDFEDQVSEGFRLLGIYWTNFWD
jgi:hypothetical protein